MRPKVMEKRINIYISPRQEKKLGKTSKDKGITLSELIRRILDEWLDRQEKGGWVGCSIQIFSFACAMQTGRKLDMPGVN